MGFLQKLVNAAGCYCAWSMELLLIYIGLDHWFGWSEAEPLGFFGGAGWILGLAFMSFVTYATIDGALKDE